MKENDIKISVIVPVYNMETEIGRCIDNLMAQTMENIEIVCVDDGSTDNTYKIMEMYAEKYSNIILYKIAHKGAGGARNYGIKKSKGEFISFMDADDSFCSNSSLEILYKTAKETHQKISGGNIIVLDDDNRISEDRSKYLNLEQGGVKQFKNNQTIRAFTRFIYSREMLIEFNIMFPNYITFEDPPFLLYAMHYSKSFVYSTVDIYKYERKEKRRTFSKKYIEDYLFANRDMVEFALNNEYEESVKNIISLLLPMRPYILQNIKDSTIINIMKNIDVLLPEQYKSSENYWLNWSYDRIQDYIKEYNTFTGGLLEKVRGGKCVIIYGAGVYGNEVYDYISQIDAFSFVGFAVTKKIKDYQTRRGVVRSLDAYEDRKESALLIIAAKEPANSHMVERAKELGFKDIAIVNDFFYPG